MNVITALDLFVYYTHKMWRKNRPAGKEEHDFERYNTFDANYLKIVQHVKDSEQQQTNIIVYSAWIWDQDSDADGCGFFLSEPCKSIDR